MLVLKFGLAGSIGGPGFMGVQYQAPGGANEGTWYGYYI